ncbi:MAG: carbohydrate ABC transporter permease [Caldilineaceae bacterium]
METVANTRPTLATAKSHPHWRQSLKTQRLIADLIAYLFLIGGSIVFLIPLIWMISTSLRPEIAVYSYPPKILPDSFLWRNYINGWNVLPFGTFLQNTLIITIGNVIGNLLSCSLVAFGFARLRGRGSNILFMLLLSTMMLPYEVTMIPQFILFTQILGWGNTFWPLMLPAWLGWPFGIFLLRQFFMTIPFDLDDAAKIDGASNLRIYWQIMLPLSKPGLAAIAIFAFMGNWNNFLAPLIYLRDMENYTLALGLRMFQGQYAIHNQHYLMAVSVMTILPIIVMFFFAQKQFIQGIALTGLKG